MKFRVDVMPKAGILDPQGLAVEQALRKLGYGEIKAARVGRAIEVDVNAPDADAAQARVQAMAEKLLCNANVEQFKVSRL